jgi:hypothetical protein
MKALDDAAMRRAIYQENLILLMHAVERRECSVETQRIFMLVISDDECVLEPTQPQPRCT